MNKEERRAKGSEVRLDRDVYIDPSMAKFGELNNQVLFAQLWTRPDLDIRITSYATMISDVATGGTEALGPRVRFCAAMAGARTRLSRA